MDAAADGAAAGATGQPWRSASQSIAAADVEPAGGGHEVDRRAGRPVAQHVQRCMPDRSVKIDIGGVLPVCGWSGTGDGQRAPRPWPR